MTPARGSVIVPGMRNLLVLVGFAALSLAACGPPGIGESCSGECEGEGICVEKVCTTACTSTFDCRADTECRVVEENPAACVNITWLGGEGEFGSNCTAADCADGFDCKAIGDPDPYAYCTAACETDRECPAGYSCLEDVDDGDVKCLRKTTCSLCSIDADCINEITPDGKCVDDSTGVKVCSKGCTTGGESCPKAFDCVGSGDNRRCEHLSGSCFGDGSTCMPCQTDADCADTDGSVCLRLLFTAETFCSPLCPSSECDDAGDPFVCADIGISNHCIPPASVENSCQSYWENI